MTINIRQFPNRVQLNGDNGCYVYDSYLNECKEWRPPQWWEFVNVFSILAVGAGAALLLLVLVFVADKAGWNE